MPGYPLTNKRWIFSWSNFVIMLSVLAVKYTKNLSMKVTPEKTPVSRRLKKYPFATAVFDNSGGEHSYNSEPLKLEFK